MPPRRTTSRSMACNGKLISQLRKRLGWTQNDLARKAGFTERLIVKAESSQNIAASTLHIIATTLTEAGEQVSPADLATDPASLARVFFLSTYEHGPRTLDVNSHFVSPDLVVHFAGDVAVFPFAGTHIGIEAARRAFALFYSVIQAPDDPSEMDRIQIVSTGHGALIWGETWAHPIGMPMTEPMKFAIKMDFDKGMLTVFDDRFDTLEGAKYFADLVQNT